MNQKVKRTAFTASNQDDWREPCKLRNFVTQLNRDKKKMYYRNRINTSDNDPKKLWRTINDLLGRNSNFTPFFKKIERRFMTRPNDIANYFNNYFIDKVDKLAQTMPNTDYNASHEIIEKVIMKNKTCTSKLQNSSIEQIERKIKSSKTKPPGVDDLDSKLLKMVAYPSYLSHN